MFFQPKVQSAQQRTLTSTPTTQVVTVTTIPIASTQTQTSAPKTVSADGTATVSPLKTPTSVVSQVKPATKNNNIDDKPEEPMDTESSPPTEEDVAPETESAVSCTASTEPMADNRVGSNNGSSGVIGAGAGPENVSSKIVPPVHNQTGQPVQKERNERVALVIGERQAAIVKPSILTHVIEGFVIQEATEPFPVSTFL